MINFDAGEIRRLTKMLAPMIDFEGQFTFYYDETNNIKKFSVRETDFNCPFTANFILGGLAYEGEPPNIQPLFNGLDLQKTVNEVKLKHIAKGEFVECLTSKKLKVFLQYLLDSKLYVHYSSLNILYWSLVDIVDSAIANSKTAQRLGREFADHLKNDLYKLSRLEIDSIVDLFYIFEYPNIKKASVVPFTEGLMLLFLSYIGTAEYHFSLESLRQILKESTRKGSLPFVMDEEDHILLKDFSLFYMRPVYMYKTSTHIFDNESSIADIFTNFKIMDNGEDILNYSFIDSKCNKFIQASDVVVGLIGKFTNYINSSSHKKIEEDVNNFTNLQNQNLDLIIKLIDKSHEKNIGFLFSVDSNEEGAKAELIRRLRNKD